MDGPASNVNSGLKSLFNDPIVLKGGTSRLAGALWQCRGLACQLEGWSLPTQAGKATVPTGPGKPGMVQLNMAGFKKLHLPTFPRLYNVKGTNTLSSIISDHPGVDQAQKEADSAVVHSESLPGLVPPARINLGLHQ